VLAGVLWHLLQIFGTLYLRSFEKVSATFDRRVREDEPPDER
jgi:hypothetical protein